MDCECQPKWRGLRWGNPRDKRGVNEGSQGLVMQPGLCHQHAWCTTHQSVNHKSVTLKPSTSVEEHVLTLEGVSASEIMCLNLYFARTAVTLEYASTVAQDLAECLSGAIVHIDVKRLW